MSDVQGAADGGTGAPPVDIETRARIMGWKPLDEFRGDPNAWRSAEEYVRVSEQALPAMAERYRTLEGRFVRQERALEDTSRKLTETQQALTEFREFSTRSEERAYQRAKKELQQRQEVAVAHADTETFKETQRELEELEQSAPPVRQHPNGQRQQPSQQGNGQQAQAPGQLQPPDPAIVGWINENQWYNRDTVLRSFATAIDSELMGRYPAMSTSERLAMVKQQTQDKFPERFENPNRQAAPAALQPQNAPARRSRAKTFADMPADAQAACDRIVRQLADAGKGRNVKPYTREDYVREYFGEEDQ